MTKDAMDGAKWFKTDHPISNRPQQDASLSVKTFEAGIQQMISAPPDCELDDPPLILHPSEYKAIAEGDNTMKQNVVRKVKPSPACRAWIMRHLPIASPIECEIAENAWHAGAESKAEVRRLQAEVERLQSLLHYTEAEINNVVLDLKRRLRSGDGGPERLGRQHDDR